jgi:hypothetical protein
LDAKEICIFLFEIVGRPSNEHWRKEKQSSGTQTLCLVLKAEKEPKLYSPICDFPQAELLKALLSNYSDSAAEITQEQQIVADEARSPAASQLS